MPTCVLTRSRTAVIAAAPRSTLIDLGLRHTIYHMRREGVCVPYLELAKVSQPGTELHPTAEPVSKRDRRLQRSCTILFLTEETLRIDTPKAHSPRPRSSYHVQQEACLHAAGPIAMHIKICASSPCLA